eukprot:CAMPEP_0171281648 /NCGR_PEP_ID=MMETSP0790-20130122/66509_1 /TAXON_ID=2925 /ORGANISM="Alexandrium catenella, Strain OF101" /LENGTH=261 /DNA_ID=CAMNT_0011750875 /DNA_START=25 /DNA_END=807 /DNA_ORIENTATION=-
MDGTFRASGQNSSWGRQQRRGSLPWRQVGGNPQDFVEDALFDAVPSGGAALVPEEPEAFLRTVRRRLDDSREQVEKLTVPTSAAEAVRGLPQEALCPVCHGPFRRSVALVPCGHAFCEGCVSHWLQRSGSCPTCRAAVERDNRWVQVRALNELVEVLRRRSSLTRDAAAGPGAAGEDLLCSQCGEAAASEHCGHCGAPLVLCRPCADTHGASVRSARAGSAATGAPQGRACTVRGPTSAQVAGGRRCAAVPSLSAEAVAAR